MKLISNIELLIRKSGYKKTFIADQLHVSVQQLRNYETGKSLIPIDKGYKLADLLGVGIEDLYRKE